MHGTPCCRTSRDRSTRRRQPRSCAYYRSAERLAPPPPVQCRPVRRAALTLILLSSLTFVLGLGVQAINDSDEAYYAEAAREMVDGRDWLTPHFNNEERWEKPILYYWFTAAAFAARHDPTEFDARALSALC